MTQTTKNLSPRFTTEEDDLLLEYVMQAKEKKEDLDAIFIIVAEKLGRDVANVAYRWKRIRKPENEEKWTPFESGNSSTLNPKNVLNKIKQTIAERDKFKAEVAEYKRLYDEVKRDSDRKDKALKDYEKTIAELGSIFE